MSLYKEDTSFTEWSDTTNGLYLDDSAEAVRENKVFLFEDVPEELSKKGAVVKLSRKKLEKQLF